MDPMKVTCTPHLQYAPEGVHHHTNPKKNPEHHTGGLPAWGNIKLLATAVKEGEIRSCPTNLLKARVLGSWPDREDFLTHMQHAGIFFICLPF